MRALHFDICNLGNQNSFKFFYILALRSIISIAVFSSFSQFFEVTLVACIWLMIELNPLSVNDSLRY